MNLPVPQVIAGFKPEAILHAIFLLLQLIKSGDVQVINDYPEVVLPSGNQKALALIQQTMKPCAAEWRGIGTIPESGLEPVSDDQNARLRYADVFAQVTSKENAQCICGQIVRGLKEPTDCPLFGTVCHPLNPQGACMVSESEGACAIAYTYGKSLSS
jgi:hydrogenase expression/formation protein HypD